MISKSKSEYVIIFRFNKYDNLEKSGRVELPQEMSGYKRVGFSLKPFLGTKTDRAENFGFSSICKKESYNQ